MSKNNHNLSKIRQTLTNVLLEASGLSREYFAKEKLTHHAKSDIDLATEADLALDAFLKSKLQHEYPDFHFLTEETAPKDFSHLETEENVWIIDPIDGTVNFSRKNPVFGISVALVSQGQTQLGMCALPMNNQVYWAQRDLKGAFCNDQPIQIFPTTALSRAVIDCDWSWNIEKRKQTYYWLGSLFPNVRGISCIGSAVVALLRVAEGKSDGYVIAGLKPWDIAAAGFIAEKAGAQITDPKGISWNVFTEDLVAANPEIHSKILALLK